MATSDSEAFESADEDLNVNSHFSLTSSENKSLGDIKSSNIQKPLSEESSAKLVDDEDNKDKESTLLEDNLKAAKVRENDVQMIDDLKGDCSGCESDSETESESTVKSDIRPNKQESVRLAGDDGNKENTLLEHDFKPFGISKHDIQIIDDSNDNSNTNNAKSDARPSKHERKRPQRTREAKKPNLIKKLGTKITPKPVSHYRNESDSVITNNEKKESVSHDELHNTEKLETLLDPGTDNATSVGAISKANHENEKKIGSVLEELSEKESSGWGSWGNWGVSSLLSTATESVSSLTSQVTQGFSSVLETGIGIPEPEELARLDRERELCSGKKVKDPSTMKEDAEEKRQQSVSEDEKAAEKQPQDEAGLFGFSRVFSGVSSITKLVETTGNKVITGGLDTLETIGKRTMEVLQEGDPGLRKKREIFSDKIILSQVLREAKEKAEMEDKWNEDKEAMRKAHFETLFDDFQGLVHLEALEMLSKQCELKVEAILQSLTDQVAIELLNKMTTLKEWCEIPDDDDDAEEEEQNNSSDEWLKNLAESSYDVGVNMSTDKIAKSWRETIQWLSDQQVKISTQEIHQTAISSLARLTAESVEQFHKTAELLLVKEDRNPFQEAHCLQEMTVLLSVHINILAGRFSEMLTSHDEDSSRLISVNEIITSIFLEASNSSSYIKEAFQLTIPVLQLGLKP